MNADESLPKIVDKVSKEIPIAARFKGPAAYCLPPTIGFKAKAIKGPKSPAYSFGIKITSDRDEKCPGPNEFFPETTRNGKSKGPAFSLGHGFKKEKILDWDTPGKDTPGPGKYCPKYIGSKVTNAPAYSISPRRPMDIENGAPGPANYEVAPTLGLHPVVTSINKNLTSLVKAAAAFTIKPSDQLNVYDLNLKKNLVVDISPGPAAYSPISPSKLKNTAPAYSLGARLSKSNESIKNLEQQNKDISVALPGAPAVVPRRPKKERPTPGPGEYTPKLAFVRENIPRFSFRCKHSDYELFVSDAVEGEFSF